MSAEVKFDRDDSLDLIDQLLDLLQYFDPGDTQFVELSAAERKRERQHMAKFLAKMPQDLVAEVMHFRDEWDANAVSHEAKCVECEETFIPNGPDDMVHVRRIDGNECGGFGVIERSWR